MILKSINSKGNKMKRIFNCIDSDMKKSVFSYGSVLCIFVTFLLCFTSSVYGDSTGKEYSVLEVMMDKERFGGVLFRSIDILHYSVSPYLTIFLPVLSSIPFVTVFCAERIGGNMRFTITRSGKYVYYFSKFLSAIVSGGAAVLLGFVLYSIVICCYFTNNDMAVSELIKVYTGMGIYGMVSVLPAFFLSAFIKNKYMICCFPFIFMHFYYTTVSKIQDIFNAHEKWDIVMKMSFLYPSELKEILFRVNTGSIIYHCALTAAALTGFIIIMNRRLDYGQ